MQLFNRKKEAKNPMDLIAEKRFRLETQAVEYSAQFNDACWKLETTRTKNNAMGAYIR